MVASQPLEAQPDNTWESKTSSLSIVYIKSWALVVKSHYLQSDQMLNY